MNVFSGAAAVLDEAAEHLSAVMGQPIAEERQIRYFLPDELSGLAIMLRQLAPIQQMAAVLYFNDQWHARAQGCVKFATGPTPEEAMQAALVLRDGDGWDLF